MLLRSGASPMLLRSWRRYRPSAGASLAVVHEARAKSTIHQAKKLDVKLQHRHWWHERARTFHACASSVGNVSMAPVRTLRLNLAAALSGCCLTCKYFGTISEQCSDLSRHHASPHGYILQPSLAWC